MLEDMIDGATGVWGLGVLAVAGGALLLARGGRPAAKTALRGWFAGRDRARELGGQARARLAEAGERVQDLYAEAKAEVGGVTATPAPRQAPAKSTASA
jgi:hypothetical protein